MSPLHDFATVQHNLGHYTCTCRSQLSSACTFGFLLQLRAIKKPISPSLLPHTAIQDDKCKAPLSLRSAYIVTLQDGPTGLTKDNLGGCLQQAAHGCCTALHRATYAGILSVSAAELLDVTCICRACAKDDMWLAAGLYIVRYAPEIHSICCCGSDATERRRTCATLAHGAHGPTWPLDAWMDNG